MMQVDDLVLHDREAVDDMVDVDNLLCAACGADGSTVHPFLVDKLVKFERASKCQFCHGVHLYCYGEHTWRELQLQVILQTPSRPDAVLML